VDWKAVEHADLKTFFESLLEGDKQGITTALIRIGAALDGTSAVQIIAALMEVLTTAAKDQTEAFLEAGKKVDEQRAFVADIRRLFKDVFPVEELLVELQALRASNLVLAQADTSRHHEPLHSVGSRYHIGTLPRASFVFVYGTSGSGKSSMALRLRRPQSASRFLSLDRYARDHRDVIHTKLSELCGVPNTNDTEEIVEASRRQPSLLVLDEFAYPDERERSNIMQMLGTLAEANLAIVACAIHKPVTSRDRHANMWTLIDLDDERFDGAAVRHLVSFLPDPQRTMMLKLTDRIVTRTRGIPYHVQRLCMSVERSSAHSAAAIEQLVNEYEPQS
jgi:hypothetical protein